MSAWGFVRLESEFLRIQLVIPFPLRSVDSWEWVGLNLRFFGVSFLCRCYTYYINEKQTHGGIKMEIAFNGKKLVDPNEFAYSLGNAAYALNYDHLKFKATDTELMVTTGFNDKLHVDLTKCSTIDDVLDQIKVEAGKLNDEETEDDISGFVAEARYLFDTMIKGFMMALK